MPLFLCRCITDRLIVVLWMWMLLGLSTASSAAQDAPDVEIGAYTVDVFLPRDYKAHAQNWVIKQADNDLIYVGNGTALLEYDGVEWRTIKVRGNAPVRTLQNGLDGRLYIGTAGDFGYLDADAVGRPAYRSLLDHRPELREAISDVWAIVPTNRGTYFSTRERLFLVDGDSIQTWTPESFFALGFEFDGRFHTVSGRDGLVMMVDDAFVPTPVADQFARDIIFYDVPLSDGSILLGSRDRGLLHYDGQKTRPFSSVNDMLVRDGHYNAVRLLDGRVAIATRNGGLYLLREDGSLDRHFTRGDGLPDVHIWNVHQDREEGLWIALNNGVARIDLSSPVTRFGELNGLPGIVIDVTRHEGSIYAASSKGLFRMETREGNVAAFSNVIDENAGQCLGLLSTEAGLLVGCELGLYVVDRSGPRRLTEMATRLFYRLPFQPGVVLASSRNYMQALRLGPGGWMIEKRIEVLTPWAISMLADGDDLWLTTVADGIVRARLDESLSVVERETFQTEAGVPDGWTYVTRIGHELRFHSMQGVFAFDRSQKRFVRDDHMMSLMSGHDDDVFLLRETGSGDVWYLNGNRLGLIADLQGDARRTEVHRFDDAGPLSIFSDASSTGIWVPATDGLYRIRPAAAREIRHHPRIAIRAVYSTQSDSLLAASGISPLTTLRVAPGTSALRFSFALIAFGSSKQREYQVKLTGADREWSAWSREPTKDYTNLGAGTYTFQVRGRDASGIETNVASLDVRISPLWHETIWAKLFVITLTFIFVGLCASLFTRIRTARLESQKEELEALVATRTVTLSQANQRLEAVVEQNNEFLSTAAHDLKNPLVSIIGFSEVLLSGESAPSEMREFLALIHESALGMNDAIDQLQTVDIVENGKLDLHLSDVDLVAAVGAVVRRNAYQAERKRIEVKILADEPVEVRVDPQFLPRIVDNLISNALKYSPPGTTVEVRLRRDSDQAVLEVKDEGPGLTTEDLTRVFGRRERLSARPTSGEGSTGLGLYIVRTLVERHGGSVEVDSIPGNGATFRVVLPLAVVSFGRRNGHATLTDA